MPSGELAWGSYVNELKIFPCIKPGFELSHTNICVHESLEAEFTKKDSKTSKDFYKKINRDDHDQSRKSLFKWCFGDFWPQKNTDDHSE